MIGKQVKGCGFRGVLEYLDSKEDSQLIGGNMFGLTPRTLAAEFAAARTLNPRLKKAVYHASLSLPKSENLDDPTWLALADDYIKGMGFQGSQYVVYRHSDRQHDHIHIVASRIRITDGSTVNDSWDYKRSEKLIRDLEQQYNLTPVEPSWSKERRRQTTEELRLIEKTGEDSIRLLLQSTIDRTTQQRLTMPELIRKLFQQGINARVTFTRTGKVKGISYSFNNINFSGTHLGAGYTFPGLSKYRNVVYSPDQNQEIQKILESPIIQDSALGAFKSEGDEGDNFAATSVEQNPTKVSHLSPVEATISNDSHSSTGDNSTQRNSPSPVVDSQFLFGLNTSDQSLFSQNSLGIQLLELGINRYNLYDDKQKKPIKPEAWLIEGQTYSLLYDQKQLEFSISHRDRGEILKAKSNGNNTELIVNSVELSDIKSFHYYLRQQKERQKTKEQEQSRNIDNQER